MNEPRVYIGFREFPQDLQRCAGMTGKFNEGFYVFINSTRHPLRQRQALGHELAHIYLGHFNKRQTIAQDEREADAQAWNYYRAFRDGLLPACKVI